jgi:hypothetical protein
VSRLGDVAYLDLADTDRARRLAVADNRASELALDWTVGGAARWDPL